MFRAVSVIFVLHKKVPAAGAARFFMKRYVKKKILSHWDGQGFLWPGRLDLNQRPSGYENRV